MGQAHGQGSGSAPDSRRRPPIREGCRTCLHADACANGPVRPLAAASLAHGCTGGRRLCGALVLLLVSVHAAGVQSSVASGAWPAWNGQKDLPLGLRAPGSKRNRSPGNVLEREEDDTRRVRLDPQPAEACPVAQVLDTEPTSLPKFRGGHRARPPRMPWGSRAGSHGTRMNPSPCSNFSMRSKKLVTGTRTPIS